MNHVPATRAAVHRYHDGTKHHFHRFARSLGYLDWASQPSPFRSFHGARSVPLYPSPDARPAAYLPQPATYDGLFADRKPDPLTASLVGDLLRHSLGLSAWKAFGGTRWSLRINPSSGNLHPTEAYIVIGAVEQLSDGPAVLHYAADRHVLEERCTFSFPPWIESEHEWFVVLTSVHWRESWKYGERAFRYCQHDLGHAIAAVRLACALVGWTGRLLPDVSHRDIAALAGIDRDSDYVDAEREDPGCVLAITHGAAATPPAGRRRDLVERVRAGRWTGRANRLSEDHVQWTVIDEIARATEDPGGHEPDPPQHAEGHQVRLDRRLDARRVLVQRRSAVALDGRTGAARCDVLAMLARTMAGPHAPWDALWWAPRVHLALFVHRVAGLEPGLYALSRRRGAEEMLKAAFNRDFLWQKVSADIPLYLLAPLDCGAVAARLSCDQDIAADGFFSLAMIAEFDGALAAHGVSFYRHLFWECGAVGHVLYLEAEAAGARATGIGCFYDDPVHDALGIADHGLQSLYHFTVGMPIEDARLTTAAGYAWEASDR